MVEVPVIDLRLAGARPEESARLRDACERLGCFRVVGHGVPAVLQAEMRAAVRALFDRGGQTLTSPTTPSATTTDIIAGSGYIAPSPANPLYEAFGLIDAAVPGDVDAFCARLDAPPHARETVKSYTEGMHELIVEVAGKVAASFGLENHSFQDWLCQFRMNKYNYTQDTVGSSGVQIHKDSGFLTVLLEDDCVGGLEVLDPAAGEFVPVEHLPGSFLVNIGDIGTAWSNGRLHSVKHRVQCVAAVQRISIAMFLLAPKDDKVCAPEAFVDAEHPRGFKPFNYDEYRKLRLSTGERAGEALARVAA